MPRSCCVPFCTTNKLKNPHLKFYILPNRSTEPRRRTRWLQAIRREDEFGHLWDPKSKHVYVCSQHFITGLKNEDIAHPDYTPSLFPHKKTKFPKSVLQRLERRRKRECVQSAQPESPTSEAPAPEALAPQSPTSEAPVPEAPAPQSPTSEAPAPEAPAPQSPTSEDQASEPLVPESPTSEAFLPLQDLERKQLNEEIYNLRRERDEAMKERDEAIRELKTLKFSVNTVRENDIKCKLMTGLSWTVFDTLHQYLVQFVKVQKTSKLSTQDQLFITLVKLRQNPSTDLMCGIFDLAHSTFLDVFSRWLDLMYAKISFLIKWPDRECIRSTVPAEVLFQYPRVTAIIDCFEIRIEHSKKLKTRAITYSKYKNWTTVKYFIACHPSGSITYLSKGWGGRASDVHIVRNSDFLSQKFHHSGDQLITPSFTRGRKQLSAEDVANSRVTSNIRIHIERVIGALKSRYHILDGPLPLRLVKRLQDERQKREEAMIDRIVHVCAALMNLSGSVMYNRHRI
ncbi:uncharacterized protein LOC115584655 isoform X2 [Sparus aurata]|uniref:uncharacterized protein LOC115584655 isoform X2 n=1 Tax=Sparus aurata TaxID=8175 RepID=UPI0011C0CC21|nr:uncharacterized protein LOC115584655 isoform X2 [Sparus aurata]